MCSSEKTRYFGGLHRLHFHGIKVSQEINHHRPYFDLENKVRCSETMGFPQIIHLYNPKNKFSFDIHFSDIFIVSGVGCNPYLRGHVAIMLIDLFLCFLINDTLSNEFDMILMLLH